MIFGDCVYCDEPFQIELMNGRVYERYECAKCGGVMAVLHSRFEPQSWAWDEWIKAHPTAQLVVTP